MFLSNLGGYSKLFFQFKRDGLGEERGKQGVVYLIVEKKFKFIV